MEKTGAIIVLLILMLLIWLNATKKLGNILAIIKGPALSADSTPTNTQTTPQQTTDGGGLFGQIGDVLGKISDVIKGSISVPFPIGGGQ